VASNFVQLISEVFQGYTELSFAGSSVFLRHITLKDQYFLEDLTKKRTAELISSGMASEKDRLEDLRRENLWGEEDNLKLAESQSYVDNLYKTKKKLPLPSQQKEVQAQIDIEEKKLTEQKNKRAELIGLTAEHFAVRKANEEFLRHLLYFDRELTRERFTEQSFGEISRPELNDLFGAYQETMTKFADEKIQEAVLQDFFSMYLPFCEKPWDFYGRPLVQLSVFQQKVLVYGRLFLSIFQNVEKIPDDIRKDPKALLDYSDSSRNKEKIKNTNKQGEGSTSFVMGTREDAQFMAGDGVEVGDLASELAKNQGYMDQNSLLKKLGYQVG